VDEACGTYARGEKRVQGTGGKDRRKNTTGRPRHRRENGIEMDPREIGRGGVGGGFTWLWGALLNAVMNLQVLAPRS
jgi:hypothetical protein